MLTTLLFVSAAAVSEPSPATDFPVACGYISADDLEISETCAAAEDGSFRIAPSVLENLYYRDGLATLSIEGSWYYLHRNGRLLKMLTYDTGPDYFSEGLARALVGSQIVYVDEGLNERIRTSYSFAFPFEDGRAIVCTGCEATRDDDGTHSFMEGGQWGAIDHEGNEVIPVSHTRDEVLNQIGVDTSEADD